MNFNGVFNAQTFRQAIENTGFIGYCRDRQSIFRAFYFFGFFDCSPAPFTEVRK